MKFQTKINARAFCLLDCLVPCSESFLALLWEQMTIWDRFKAERGGGVDDITNDGCIAATRSARSLTYVLDGPSQPARERERPLNDND